MRCGKGLSERPFLANHTTSKNVSKGGEEMKTKKGFTLVELLVVIAIIGLLSTIAFISLNRARAKARDAKRVSDVRQIQSALELYYSDQASPSYPVLSPAAAWTSMPNMSPGYIGTIPPPTTPADNSTGSACTTANNAYMYRSTNADGTACAVAPCAGYRIDFCLGAQTGGLPIGVRFATQDGIQ